MQFNDPVYAKSHMIKVMALDMLIVVIGLALAASPFVMHNFPGDVDTTSHVALGMLIAVPAAFRAVVAYASLWVEVVEFFLGLIVLRLPVIMHMQWEPKYNTAHLVLGGAVMALAMISLLVTIPVVRKGTAA